MYPEAYLSAHVLCTPYQCSTLGKPTGAAGSTSCTEDYADDDVYIDEYV
jgi:hypothetical protein